MQALHRLAVSVAVLLALPSVASAQSRETGFELEPGTTVLPPIRFEQLSIFPVVAQPVLGTGRYLSLADGLKQKKVRVTEAPQGAQVNRVAVENDSDSALLLLGGELILGGQQDRVLSKDMVLAPHERASVEVYCVEHGRWQGSREFGIVGGMVGEEIRREAKHHPDQQRVWQAVAKANSAFGAAPPTGTYRNVGSGAEGARAVEPFRKAIGAALASHPRASQMTGIIATINGQVVSVDLFSTPQLFGSHRERLLDSIFLSAAATPAKQGAEKPATPSDIKAFLKKGDAGAAEVIADDGRSRSTQKHGKDVVSSTVEVKSAGKLAPVYKSYQANQ